MARLHDVLTEMVAALSACGVVENVALGVEPNITGNDFPLIRVVPVKVAPRKGSGTRSMEATVYFGDKLAAYKGAGTIYGQMATMEDAIITALRSGAGWKADHIETLFDDDCIPGVKLAAARFDVVIAPR